MRYIVGIDEAGRGPLAGPVAVAAVKVGADFNKEFFVGIKDSKQLTAEERELWFNLANEARKRGELSYAVSLVRESVIDRKGITYAVSLGIKRCLEKLGVESGNSQIFLDGGIKAPASFEHQLTVIKGDEKIPIVSLASILAKVTRDRRMVRFSKLFPHFSFDKHKGYATRFHREAILKYGYTELHRKTFLKRLIAG